MPIDNPEKVVADHLRAVAGARVVARTPDNTDDAWVRLTMVDAGQTEFEPDHLIACFFQHDCYAGKAGGQPEAMALSWTIRSALLDMPRSEELDVVVTGARIVGHSRIPDRDFTPDRERVQVSARLWMHAEGS